MTRNHENLYSAVPDSHLTHMHSPRRNALLASASLLLVSIAFTAPRIGDWAILAPDSFNYLQIARTLAETGAFPQHRLTLPPGFPALLAPLVAWNSLPLAQIRVLLALCLAASAALTYFLFRRQIGGLGAFVTAILLVVNATTLTLTASVLSEIIFLPFSLACLLIADSWQRRERISLAAILCGAFLATFATFLRSMAVVLAPVMALAILLSPSPSRKHRIVPLVVFTFAFTMPQLLWLQRQSTFPHRYDYFACWTQPRHLENTAATGAELHLHRLVQFGPQRLADIKAALLPEHLAWRAFNPPFNVPLNLLIGGGLVVVTIVRAFRFKRPPETYALLTLFLLAIWPWYEGPRLLMPILPVLLASAVWLFQRTARLFESRPARGFVLAGGPLCLIAMHVADWRFSTSPSDRIALRASDDEARMRHLADWLHANTSQSAPILFASHNGDPNKTLAAGAAYLARRNLEFRDVHPGESLYLSDQSVPFILLADPLKDEIAPSPDYSILADIGPFRALSLSRQARIDAAD